MATLAVRALRLRDLASLRSTAQRVDSLEGPTGRYRASRGIVSPLVPALRGLGSEEAAFVATVDGELCAYLVALRDTRQFQWEIAYLAAGSPRLDATESVSVELWSALVGYCVKQAGASGAKRVFAMARRGTPAYASLRATGFEAYEDRLMLTGSTTNGERFDAPSGVRPQSNSDVWSIHQLYHHVTPRAVQFAEALTSARWELADRSWFNLQMVRGTQDASYVLEYGEGVVGHCRIERRHGCALATYMLAPEYAHRVADFLIGCAKNSGVTEHDELQVCVPGYAMDHVSQLEEAGFRVSWERTALVKHTTASVVVRPKLVPVQAVEERERAIHGVPTLYQ